MSACAPRICAIGRATAPACLGCSPSTSRARRSPSAWTTASSASSSMPTAAKASVSSVGKSPMPRRSTRLPAHLENNEIKVARGARALADERHVKDLIVFNDPIGNRLEIFHGAETTAEPFKPGRSISGFRTGPLGLGHVVLNVDTRETIDKLMAFYRRHPRFPADRLLRPSVRCALPPPQSAPSQPRLHPDRQERRASHHDGALLVR